MTTFLLICFAVVSLTVIGILCFTFTRESSPTPNFSMDLDMYEEQLAARGRPSNNYVFFLRNDSPLYGYQGPFSQNLASSESCTIRISPSRPAIFGDEKNAESALHVVLTPPTPAKRERRFSTVNKEDEE